MRRVARSRLLALVAGALALAPTTTSAADVGGYEDVPTMWFSRPAAGHVVALTFDDGWGQGPNLHAIVDILSAEGVAATFFPAASSVQDEPEVWQRIAREGYPIGNHSLSHPDLTTLPYSDVLRQLTEWRRIVEETIDAPTIPYMRPPFGYFNRTVLRAAGEAGYVAAVNWDVDTIDWRDPADLVALRGVRGGDGSIVLLHAEDSTVQALPAIIASYKERGFRFVTVPQLLDGATPDRGPAQTRVINLRRVNGASPPVDVFVLSSKTGSLTYGGSETQNVAVGALAYNSRTGYFAPAPLGAFRIARAGSRPEACSESTCGLIASPRIAGNVRSTIVVHRGGALQLIETGTASVPDANLVALSPRSVSRGNLYVVGVALIRNSDGLRLRRRGRVGCISSANLPGALIKGAPVHNFQIPAGTSTLTLHAPTDRNCSRAPVGGPFTLSVGTGARKYLFLRGAPGSMLATVAGIPTP